MNATTRRAGRTEAAAFDGLRAKFSAFWNARNPREQRLLSIGAIVVVAGLFYVLLIDPALSGRALLARQLPTLRQQTAEVQALARELAGMKSGPEVAVAPITREGLETALASKGLKAENIAVTGEVARLQFNAVSFSALIDWLEDMHRTAHAAVTEATVEAQATTDIVNATLTLRQPRGEEGAGSTGSPSSASSASSNSQDASR